MEGLDSIDSDVPTIGLKDEYPWYETHRDIRTLFFTGDVPETQTVWYILMFFLETARTRDGATLWDKTLEQAGPKPQPPPGLKE